MADDKPSKKRRRRDPYIDRRSGEERRQVYDSDYFEEDGKERRNGKDRRKKKERRKGCIQVSDWTSICPDEKKKK